MRAAMSNQCLTRVVIDDDGVIVAQLQAVRQRIQGSLRSIPPEQREYVADALLNLAVSRMVCEEGPARIGSMLMRLGDVVNHSESAPPIRAVNVASRRLS